MVSNDELDAVFALLNKAASSLIKETKLSDSDNSLMKELQIKVREYVQLAETASNGGLSGLSDTEFDEYCYTKLELENHILIIEASLKSSLYAKEKLQREFVETLTEYKSKFSNSASYFEGEIAGVEAQKMLLARKGGTGKSSKYQPLKDLAKTLLNATNFKSRRNAAITIKPEILKKAKELEIPLSEMQAESTITKWLKEMGLPANI